MTLMPLMNARGGRLGLMALLAGGLIVTGCASAPAVPVTSLDAARAAIVSAERFDAGRFAAFDLGDARQRLALADAAVREQRMEQAERFAAEARAGAELAYAKTEAAKAAAINAEMQRSEDALVEEMNRAGERR